MCYVNPQSGRFSDEDDDIPSAPPFYGSAQEIRQTREKIPASVAHTTPNKAESSTLKSTSEDKIENHIGNENRDQFARLVYLIK